MNRKRNTNDRGFTLVELIVVVALIGLMTALIVPEMRGTYEDAVLRSTARQIVNICHLAYSRSVTSSQTHRVRLDRSQGRYLLEKLQADSSSGFSPVRDTAASAGTLDKRISIEFRPPDQEPGIENESESEPPLDNLAASRAEADPESRIDAITFYPDGTADAKQIVLRDRQGFQLALRVNPITGQVRLVEMERN